MPSVVAGKQGKKPMECYELVKENGGWKTMSKMFVKFESAVDYAVSDLQYMYLKLANECDENTLKFYFIDPDEMEEKSRHLREYLMNGDGFAGLMGEYYEIRKIEVIED